MNRSIIILLTIISFITFLVNCTKDKITHSEENTNCKNVPIQVDFIYGVENHHVILYFNDQIYFSALLSETVMLSGPIARFTTELPRTENTIFVFCRNIAQPSKTYQDSISIHLENARMYYFGVELIDGLFHYTLQDKPFGY